MEPQHKEKQTSKFLSPNILTVVGVVFGLFAGFNSLSLFGYGLSVFFIALIFRMFAYSLEGEGVLKKVFSIISLIVMVFVVLGFSGLYTYTQDIRYTRNIFTKECAFTPSEQYHYWYLKTDDTCISEIEKRK